MNNTYILKGTTPVACHDPKQWATWFATANRRVEQTQVGKVKISTVFLGLDHNFSDQGPPLLFATMVFGGALDHEQVYYTSWNQAKRGHQIMVERVKQRMLRQHGKGKP